MLKTKSCLLIILIIGSSVLIPAIIITLFQPPPEDAIELQLHLIFECHGELEGTYQLSYGWSATGFEGTEAIAKLQWRSSKATALGITTDPVHQAIGTAFSEIDILDDSLHVYSDGRWSLDISSRVQQHVTLGIEATGVNDTIQKVNPYADLSLVPSSLKTALSEFGIETVDVRARIALRIQGSLLAQFFSNVGYVISIYVDIVKETVAILLGVILITQS